ncbi:hypothetical protein [Citrobacter sp. FDAARGOS_156]|uniref:hypothetical protein n=1 Tax=Citrobacter sp. FDAARGOS_156 TaxID=1702170 RepID=UPI001900AEA5|nr:hypothetical protein [Citrobacter sp. FDAARGOS_156]MBJ8925427.1 hypothetical protein [Citrobacter sp. FDAARGOS_156]
MDNEIIPWLGGVLTSVSLTGIIGYLWRDSFGRFMSKGVEHKFEKRIEAFKAEIRKGEKELERINDYLISARTGRESVLQSKKIEAAENVLLLRKHLHGLNPAIEYLKMLDIDNLLKNGGEKKVQDFVDATFKNFMPDEKLKVYSELDRNTAILYLSDTTIKTFEAYKRIMSYGVAVIKVLEIPFGDKDDLLKHEEIKKAIIDAHDESKNDLDAHGRYRVFYWADFFYEKLLKDLRSEILGEDSWGKDKEFATRMALDSHQAQMNIRVKLKEHGLSDSFVQSDSIDKVL